MSKRRYTLILEDELADPLELVASVMNESVTGVLRAALRSYLDGVRQDAEFQAAVRRRMQALGSMTELGEGTGGQDG